MYSSAAESFSFDEQDEDENFDLALIASLEVDVTPLLGDARVPDYLLIQLGKTLDRGSILYDPLGDAQDQSDTQLHSPRRRKSRQSIEISTDPLNGNIVPTTANGLLLPRERFAYWCFDLLFLICSDTAKGFFFQ